MRLQPEHPCVTAWKPDALLRGARGRQFSQAKRPPPGGWHDEATDRLRGVLGAIREGFFECDEAGGLRAVNPSLAVLLGHKDTEAFLREVSRLSGFMDAVDESRLLDWADRRWPSEMRLRRRDGSSVWVELHRNLVRDGETVRVCAVLHDLSPMRLETETSARLEAIVDAADEAISAWDLGGHIIAWNRGAELLFGYTAQEALGRHAQELIVPPNRAREVNRMLDEFRAGRRVAARETYRLRKDGSQIQVSVVANPVFDAQGLVVGAAVTAHDISDRLRGEQARLALTRQEAEVLRLQDVSRVRSEFLSEAAHELKTPLTPVLIHLQMLQELPGLRAAAHVSLEVIERNVLRLRDLVRDLLDASRLEAGRLKLQPEVVSLPRALADTVEAFRAQALQAGLTLESKGETLDVEADPARVTQVLFNLVSNGIKFTARGGSILLSTVLDGGQARVCVTDTGLGLAPDQLSKLFLPFGRLHEDVKGTASGTGLGLFISKAIVEQHGGRMWAESPGKGLGTTICFTLPLAGRDPRPLVDG